MKLCTKDNKLVSMSGVGVIELCIFSGVITTILMNKSLAKLRFCDAAERSAFQLRFATTVCRICKNVCPSFMREKTEASYLLGNQISGAYRLLQISKTFKHHSSFFPFFFSSFSFSFEYNFSFLSNFLQNLCIVSTLKCGIKS